ncbi:MAG: hypothetical protein NT117_12965 [Gammaproteobacteria bacterium]|nr:hypothetical protein [Gammaproteobacteria bacterium]
MDDQEFNLPRIPLAQALAALPLETPDRSAWPALAARLDKRRRMPRWPMALAAGLLALALLPRGWYPDPSATAPSQAGAPTTTASAGESRAQLASLMSESARLERLVSAASDDGASSGSAAALSLALEDKLAALDAELESGPDATTQLSLWQQRVELMRNIAAVETSRHYLAAEGGNLDVALVAAY